MTVFVLTDDIGFVCGVFSSFENADKARKEALEDEYEERKVDYEIEEFKLDI